MGSFGLVPFTVLLCTTALVRADDSPPGRPTPRDTVRAAVRAAAAGSLKPDDLPPEIDEPQHAAAWRWLTANAEALNGVRAGPLADLPWGFSTLRPASDGKPTRLYLHVFEWHAGGRVIAYGLAPEGVRSAFLLSDPRTKLAVSGTDRAVLVTVPKQPPDPIATVVVLEIEGEPKTVPLAIQPGSDDRIVLHARDAIVHGKTLRYEPEPHKDTVGYWMDPADWVRWDFEVKRPGTYGAVILQGCGKGHGGSTVEFSTAGQTLGVTVEDTGHFQNFVNRRIGAFTFDKPGRYTLTVKPTRKASVAVMDLRSVTLTRAPAPN